MSELTFNVERCGETGLLSASWDEPAGNGGITTQGKDLRELQEMVKRRLFVILRMQKSLRQFVCIF